MNVDDYLKKLALANNMSTEDVHKQIMNTWPTGRKESDPEYQIIEMDSVPKQIVGIDFGSDNYSVITTGVVGSKGEVIIVDEKYSPEDRWMQGHDPVFVDYSEIERRVMAEVVNMFDFRIGDVFGNYKNSDEQYLPSMKSYHQVTDMFRRKPEQKINKSKSKREVVLARRAKDKSNRKKGRR